MLEPDEPDTDVVGENVELVPAEPKRRLERLLEAAVLYTPSRCGERSRRFT
jgi:hypothetical protein